MLTYSSYLKRKTNLTSSGLVVGFSNSAFEVLAGIGVFATLGHGVDQQLQARQQAAQVHIILGKSFHQTTDHLGRDILSRVLIGAPILMRQARQEPRTPSAAALADRSRRLRLGDKR